MRQRRVLFFLFVQALGCDIFSKNRSAIFIKVVLVILFLRYQSCNVKKNIDKENISTSNSSDFTQEIKNLHFFGSITYKNRGNLTKLWLQRLAEIDGEMNQNYPKWMASETLKSGTAGPLLFDQMCTFLERYNVGPFYQCGGFCESSYSIIFIWSKCTFDLL